MRTYILVLIISLVSATASAKGSETPWFMEYAAKTFNVDIDLLTAICTVESGCKANRINHDDGTLKQKSAGIKSKSYGMFQIKLSTAKWLGFSGPVSALVKPDVNAYYAAKFIAKLYSSYKLTSKVISAYNAGHPTSANKGYVNKVLSQYVFLNIDRKRIQ